MDRLQSGSTSTGAPIHGRTADLRKPAVLLLFLIASIFTLGAFSDVPFLRPLLELTCHRLPERSFAWTPGLCARCSFFWMGMAASLPLMYFRKMPGSLLAGLLLVLPLVIDGSLQFAGLYQSTNPVRLITGFLAGTGICMLFEGGIRTD